MKTDYKNVFAEKVQAFSLPKYNELPTIGLYLDQVTQYINNYVVPVGCPEITASMISNYVKQNIIPAPVIKQYPRETIAYLIAISICKSALSIESMGKMFAKQRQIYDVQTAYDYFCCELENVLYYISGLKEELDTIGVTNTELKKVLRSAISASAHIMYINNSLDALS